MKSRVALTACETYAQGDVDRALDALAESLDLWNGALPDAERVLIKPKDVSVAEVIQRESANAEVVFLGLGTPKPGDEADYARRLDTLAGDLPVVFFVKNASIFIGELLESPEEEFEEVSDEESEDDPQKNNTNTTAFLKFF